MTEDTPEPMPRKKPGRPKKVKPEMAPPPLIPTKEGQAERVVQYLTLKLGRPPTNHELLGWAKSLRDGAEALESFVQAGGMDSAVPAPSDVEETGPKSKKKREKGFRFDTHQRPDVVCDICESPGHTAERCPETA